MMSECSGREAPPVVILWGVRLAEGEDGAERGVRMPRCSTGAGFDRANP